MYATDSFNVEQWTLRGLCIGTLIHHFCTRLEMLYNSANIRCTYLLWFTRIYRFSCRCLDSSRNNQSSYPSLHYSLHWYRLTHDTRSLFKWLSIDFTHVAYTFCFLMAGVMNSLFSIYGRNLTIFTNQQNSSLSRT